MLGFQVGQFGLHDAQGIYDVFLANALRWVHDSGDKRLTLNFSVCRIYTVVIMSNPGRRFHGASKTSNVRKVYPRLGARFDDPLTTHN